MRSGRCVGRHLRLNRHVQGGLFWGAFASVCAFPAFAQVLPDAKAELSDAGLNASLVYDGDIATNAAGGLKRGTVYMGNLHLKLQVEGETLFGQPGLRVFLDGLGIHGGQASGLAGDAQGVSNIAAPTQFRLYEAWVQFNTADGRLSVLAGQYDLNSEFYRLDSAGLFLNSSFGIGPEFAFSGNDGPSIFPDTSLGLRAGFKLSDNIVIRAAVLDGVPVHRPEDAAGIFSGDDGLLLAGEMAYLTRPGQREPMENMRSLIGRASALAPYDDKIAIGGWYYTAKFPDQSEAGSLGEPTRHHGTGGLYLLMDALLYQPQANPDLRVSGFLQAGIGSNRVNRFHSYFGFGLTATGLIPDRASDELGIATAVGGDASHYVQAQELAGVPVTSSEIAVEFTYLAQIADWLAVQPDVQYVIHPNTDPQIANALVFQLQLEVSL